MKRILPLLNLLLLAPAGPALAQDGDFVVVTTLVTPQGQREGAVYFFGGYAVEASGGEAGALYSLDEMWWRELDGTTENMTLEEAEAWSEANRADTEAMLRERPEDPYTPLLRAAVHPDLVVEERGDTLTFRNDVLRYDITETTPLTEEQSRRFYAYDRLNAHRKTIVFHQYPAFTQLEVSAVLAARRVLPAALGLTVHMPTGTVEVNVSVEVKRVAPEEATAFRALVPDDSTAASGTNL
jgi:hypothetical protein